ncbi:BrnT family toxin [Bartonella sp. AU18XJBT]|uniref:BrnT family toxin n=1 Tax=Bartonella sp. AU18XJBT TaxID=3019089 RepID=UPI00235FE853|nr:BrnT family toxin [Bartonella sp. AU18XJBT]
MKIRFEWDETKAKSNLRKHRVSFEIAARVFADPFAMVKQDRIENGEYRWQTLGLVDGFLLLLVAHTVHDDKDGIEVIRIISARRANSKERKHYEEESSL